jgi:hypothetical protein
VMQQVFLFLIDSVFDSHLQSYCNCCRIQNYDILCIANKLHNVNCPVCLFCEVVPVLCSNF